MVNQATGKVLHILSSLNRNLNEIVKFKIFLFGLKNRDFDFKKALFKRNRGLKKALIL